VTGSGATPSAATVAPSGRQVELALGDQRAVLVEVGGGLRSYDVGARAVVDGYHLDELCSGGRGQLLVPWPNRIGGGRYRFAGVDHQLPLDEPGRRNAIHGLVRWAPWEIERPSPAHATARHRLHPRPGYPFRVDLEADYQLSARGLTVTVSAVNRGARPAPYGAGWHPYLTVSTPRVDDAVLEVPADRAIPTDDRGLPCGDPMPVEGTPLDFRRPRPIGAGVLDTCYTDLARGADGHVRVRLSGPDGAPTVELWADRSVTCVMVFTGDTLAPGRRRRGLAVEPMTCAPDAFRSGPGLVVLEPGESTTATWGISPGAGLAGAVEPSERNPR
jgi:aldose 1-epimerase